VTALACQLLVKPAEFRGSSSCSGSRGPSVTARILSGSVRVLEELPFLPGQFGRRSCGVSPVLA